MRRRKRPADLAATPRRFGVSITSLFTPAIHLDDDVLHRGS
jgi:hypothetical protein